MIENIAKHFNDYPDMVLSLALLAAAAGIIAIALLPVNHWIKALALAYVVLP